MEDIRLMIGDVKFSARAVAVIQKKGKILFQKRKNDEFWALPGGAIATLERGKDVVTREIYEETGEKNSKVIRPLWFQNISLVLMVKNSINIFQAIQWLFLIIQNFQKKNEFDGIEKEKNIIYKWIDIKDLNNSPIKPEFLKEKLSLINETFEFIEEDNL